MIPDKLYYKIGEVAKVTGVKPYVIRYWETEFRLIRPQKSRSGQRLYQRKDIELLLQIKQLLYDEKYTISGAKKRLKLLRAPAEQQLALDFGEPAAQEEPAGEPPASPPEEPPLARAVLRSPPAELLLRMEKEIEALFELVGEDEPVR